MQTELSSGMMRISAWTVPLPPKICFTLFALQCLTHLLAVNLLYSSTMSPGGLSEASTVSFDAHVHHCCLSFVENCATVANLRSQTSHTAHSTVSKAELTSGSAVKSRREEAIDDRLCNGRPLCNVDVHGTPFGIHMTDSLSSTLSRYSRCISLYLIHSHSTLCIFFFHSIRSLNTLSDRAAMKSSAALSLLFFLPSIRAAAVPQLIGSELESTSSTLKRDTSGNLTPRSPQPGSSELVYEASEPEQLPKTAVSFSDDPSLDLSTNSERDLSTRDPQGPASNPGEFTDVGLSRVNPANQDSSADSSSSISADDDEKLYTVTAGLGPINEAFEKSRDEHPGRKLLMGDDGKMEHHRHHDWNRTDHGHRKDGILAEFNSHGEHIVVYNGTHYPNGTSYSPKNETMDGGKLLDEVVVAGDEVVVYSQPWNRTHHHHHHNHTGGAAPTATGVWLPSGTGWIPSSTGRPRHHRKVPSAAYAGFEGPMSKRDGSLRKDAGGLRYGK